MSAKPRGRDGRFLRSLPSLSTPYLPNASSPRQRVGGSAWLGAGGMPGEARQGGGTARWRKSKKGAEGGERPRAPPPPFSTLPPPWGGREREESGWVAAATLPLPRAIARRECAHGDVRLCARPRAREEPRPRTHARPTPYNNRPLAVFFFFCALRGVRPPFSGSSLFLGPSATPSSAPAFAPCTAFKAFQGLADPPSALAAWRAGPVWAWRPCRSRAHQTSDPPRAENRTCQEKRGGGPLTQLRPHNLSSLPLPSRQGSNPLKMGVPKRVPSLNSQVEAKVRELGGDKAIHR